MPDEQLTDHFTWADVTKSSTADKKGIDNSLPPEYEDNARRVARWLESVRSAELGSNPVTVLSWYRSPELNAVLPGSSSTSAHMRALAVDIVCPKYGTPFELARRLTLSPGLSFDQIIYEGSWVHVGLAEDGIAPRLQVLTKVPGGYNEGLYYSE